MINHAQHDQAHLLMKHMVDFDLMLSLRQSYCSFWLQLAIKHICQIYIIVFQTIFKELYCIATSPVLTFSTQSGCRYFRSVGTTAPTVGMRRAPRGLLGHNWLVYPLQGGCWSVWLLIIWSLISWLFDEWPLPNMYHSLGLIGWLACLCVDLLIWRLHRGSECSPDGLIDFLIILLIGCLSGCAGSVEICLRTQPQVYLLTDVVSFFEKECCYCGKTGICVHTHTSWTKPL